MSAVTMLMSRMPSSILLAALMIQLIAALGGWVLLLCRDRQRQQAAERLLHASEGQHVRMVLDGSGRIEVDRTPSAHAISRPGA